MRRPDEPVRGRSAGDGLASRALRLAFRFYLPVAAAACMVVAVLLVLGAPEVSRGASLIALGAVGVGALAIAARSLWGPREPRSPSSRADPFPPEAPGEAPSVPPERRPDLNQRFLPLHSTVHSGQFRSGGPVVAVMAVPAPMLLRGETWAPQGPPTSDRSPAESPAIPRPFETERRTLPPMAHPAFSTDQSGAWAGRTSGVGPVWAEATNPLPPHLRSPVEDRGPLRTLAPFERRLPRGRIPRGRRSGPT